MKAVLSAAAFAAAASAAVLRRDQCCFQIYASGGVSGLLGQLDDGQNRINGSYAPETYCYSNGGIIDAHGRGCIVTIGNDATHQFQCDQGKPPTLGFSIANNGSILYQGSDQFYACPYINEYNVYTQWLKNQDKCRPVKLSMNGTCSASAGPTGGFAAPSGQTPGYSIPAYGGSSAGGSVPGYGQQTVPAGTAPYPTGGYGSQTVPTYPSGSQPVLPGYGGLSEDTSAATVPASTAPGYAGSASSVESSPVESTPVVPGYGPSSEVTSQATVPSYGSASTSVPGYGSSVESTPVASTSQPVVPGYGGSSEVTSAQTVPATSQVSVPGYGSPASVSGYGSSIETSPVQSTASQPSAPGYSQPATSEASVPGYSSSAPAPSSESQATVPGYGGETSSAVESTPAISTPAQSTPAESTPVQSTPVRSIPVESSPVESTPTTETMQTTQVYTVPCSSCEGQTSVVTQTPPAESTPAQSTPAHSTPQESSPVESTPAIQPATSTTASACQTSLTGSYQTPHLIVPIASSYPDTPQGNSYNASINSDCSTIFNFDIPESYSGKTCSTIFLFPEQKDLETSAYTFSGSGDLVFSSCNGVANEQTTYNNAPAKNGTLDSVCIEPGNSYVVNTAPCAAGTTQSIELSSANGLSLEFFEDWNPSSLGLYITAC